MNLHLVKSDVVTFALQGGLFEGLQEGDCLFNKRPVTVGESVLTELFVVVEDKGGIGVSELNSVFKGAIIAVPPCDNWLPNLLASHLLEGTKQSVTAAERGNEVKDLL